MRGLASMPLTSLWALVASPLVGAAAIDSPQAHHPRASTYHDQDATGTERESGSPAGAFLSWDLPDNNLGYSPSTSNTHTLFIEISPSDDSPCGPANITINAQPLGSPTGNALFDPLHEDGPSFQASWDVQCIDASPDDSNNSNHDESDGGETFHAAEASQLLSFDIHLINDREVPQGAASFIAQFRQTEPAEILSVAGPAIVSLVGGPPRVPAELDGYLSEDGRSMLEDLAELEALRVQLARMTEAVAVKEKHITEEYGLLLSEVGSVDVDACAEEGGLVCKMKQAMSGASSAAKDLVKSVLGEKKKEAEEEEGRGGYCRLGDDDCDDDDGEMVEGVDEKGGEGGKTTTSFGMPPPRGKQHPITTGYGDKAPPSYKEDGDSGGDDGNEGNGWPQDLLAKYNVDMVRLYQLLAAVTTFVVLAILLHRLCLARSAHRAERLARRASRREERRAARQARRQAFKRTVRSIFRRVLCRPSLEDEEKEAERERMSQSIGNGGLTPAGSSPSWINFDVEAGRPGGRSYPFRLYTDDEEEPGNVRRGGATSCEFRGARGRDAESITLVGSDRDAQSVRRGLNDEYDDEKKQEAEQHKTHHDSDDAASESGSVASVSDVSGDMDMDLAGFREATFMVGNMVAARDERARQAADTREAGEGEQEAQQGRREVISRPVSPTVSLPGYASEDPYPPAYETDERGSLDEEAVAHAAVADGFRYQPTHGHGNLRTDLSDSGYGGDDKN